MSRGACLLATNILSFSQFEFGKMRFIARVHNCTFISSFRISKRSFYVFCIMCCYFGSVTKILYAFLSFFFRTGALQIINSEESDQGKYQCVAENSVGTEYSQAVGLYVKGKYRRVGLQIQPACFCNFFPPPYGYVPVSVCPLVYCISSIILTRELFEREEEAQRKKNNENLVLRTAAGRRSLALENCRGTRRRRWLHESVEFYVK